MKKIIVSLCIAVCLSACGFHIRGSIELPKNLSNLYLSAADSKGALVTDLRQQLKANRISLTDNPVEANYTLAILEEIKDRHTSGVGGDSLSSAYEITLKANYEIRLKNSNQVTKGTAISVRNFNYNTAAINTATQEELLLDQEMRRDLSQQILRRLGSVVTSPPVEKNSKSSKHSAPSNSEPGNGKTAP